jgi:hypothetical protein
VDQSTLRHLFVELMEYERLGIRRKDRYVPKITMSSVGKSYQLVRQLILLTSLARTAFPLSNETEVKES